MQIGPRLRIGGSVGRAGQNAKKAVIKGATDAGHAVGEVANNKWAKLAAAAALAATGVGAGASAAILGTMGAAGGALHRGGGLRDAAIGGATGAAEGYAAGKIGQGLRGAGKLGKLGALMGIKSRLPGGSGIPQLPGGSGVDLEGNPLPDKITYGIDGTVLPNGVDPDDPFGSYGWPSTSAIDDNDPFGPYGKPSASGGGSWYDPILKGAKTLLPGAVKAATGGGGGGLDLGALAMGGLAAWQMRQAGMASAKAGKLSGKALNLAEQRWNDDAPLRAAGTQGLLTPKRVSLSGVYNDPSNVFSRRG